MKKLQNGRSMVEMLGVLAIIGVLSVGAIAGYQKAMMKYKLNKHAQSFNLLLNASLQYGHQLKGKVAFVVDNNTEYYAGMLNKLNVIPDNIKYINETTLRDIFNNNIVVFGGTDILGITINLNKNNYNIDICKNYVQVAKEYHSELKEIFTQQYSNNIVTSGIGRVHGDKYCKNNMTCLRNLNLNNINELCNTCIDNCSLYIMW